MSFRSGSNSDFVVNNLKVNGTMSLENELKITILDLEGDTTLNTLEVQGDATLDTLEVANDTTLNALTVSGNTVLNNLDVTGYTDLSDLQVTNKASVNAFDCNGPCNLYMNTSVENLSVSGELTVFGDVVSGGETITPEELGSVSGVTGNIQDQLDEKIGVNNPIFTGTAVLPPTKFNGYAYIGNDSSSLPTYQLSIILELLVRI
jgi:hypothetical protein